MRRLSRTGVALRRFLLPAGLFVAALLLTAVGTSRAAAVITYHAGWNIAGAPDGTRYAGADGPIYALQAGDDQYEALPPGTPAIGGFGYWVYFPLARSVRLTDGAAFTTIQLPPRRWILVGNPSGLRTAPVNGADALYTWDPERGYRATSSLLPGEGAWAYSENGGLLTIGVPDQDPAIDEPEVGDTPPGPVGALDAEGCRTGEVLAGVYRPARLQVLTPCLTVTGTVQEVRIEPDGDYHVQLALDPGQEALVNRRNQTIQHGYLVVEVIPADQRNLAPPLPHERVAITGAHVLDRDHGWLEIHPAWSITPLRR
jgi:hypothetical protein